MQKNFNVTLASIMSMHSNDTLKSAHQKETGNELLEKLFSGAKFGNECKPKPKEIFLSGVFNASVLESGGYDSCFQGMAICYFM